jgi:hypothetical protein
LSRSRLKIDGSRLKLLGNNDLSVFIMSELIILSEPIILSVLMILSAASLIFDAFDVSDDFIELVKEVDPIREKSSSNFSHILLESSIIYKKKLNFYFFALR